MKNIYLIVAFIFVFLNGCGQPTKISNYSTVDLKDKTYGMMTDGVDQDRLRIAMLDEGFRIIAFQQEVAGSDRQKLEYKQVNVLVKFHFQEDRPCLFGKSSLGYGKIELVDSSSGATISFIEEMGFTEPCLGSEAIYGNVFKKLAKSLKAKTL